MKKTFYRKILARNQMKIIKMKMTQFVKMINLLIFKLNKLILRKLSKLIKLHSQMMLLMDLRYFQNYFLLTPDNN
jgi:hypothetical protein